MYRLGQQHLVPLVLYTRISHQTSLFLQGLQVFLILLSQDLPSLFWLCDRVISKSSSIMKKDFLF